MLATTNTRIDKGPDGTGSARARAGACAGFRCQSMRQGKIGVDAPGGGGSITFRRRSVCSWRLQKEVQQAWSLTRILGSAKHAVVDIVIGGVCRVPLCIVLARDRFNKLS